MDISEHRLTILFIENRLANICFDFGFHKSQLTFGFKIVFDFFLYVSQYLCEVNLSIVL